MHRLFMLAILLMTLSSGSFALEKPGGPRIEFARDVRPLLVRRCFACHGPEKQRGGLRLDRKTAALTGGEDGPAIVPGKAEESALYRLAAGLEDDRVMPPKGERLTAEELGLLKGWIDQGAEWPGSAADGDGRDWWSLKPLVRPAVPALPASDAAGMANPIDWFIRAKLGEKGLKPSLQADRRTLVRRLYFDLVGLPPTLEEIEAFAGDADPLAYERLVDRLLDSPHHGERWARHWLDVVHYGETHGYDKDQPRPNAWPYRDYVIRAFNSDKPYGRFVEEQVAGDVLYPSTIDGITALGFIAAGPWDLIGHAEVPETKIDGKVARHLDRDDMVATTINTFVSLTAQCAQCHNHKFDPIRQEEYYGLQAVFAALDRADRPFYSDPATAREADELLVRKVSLRKARKELLDRLAKAGGAELEKLDRRIADATRPGGDRPESGYHSGIETLAESVKWVQVDLGSPSTIDRVVLWGCHDTFNGIGAGFGFPRRFKVESSDDPEFRVGVHAIIDRSAQDVPSPGIASVAVPANRLRARYVRVTATRLAPRQNDFNFALAELEVLDTSGRNLAAGKPVAARDSIEAGPRWARSNLVDGYAPGRTAAGDPARLKRDRQVLVEKLLGADRANALNDLDAELGTVEARLAKVPPSGKVYAGTIHDGGSAAFRGTGPDGGRPRTIRVLRRGDVKSPGKEVEPGALDVASELPGTFDLPSDHTEGDRRAALARWLTDRRNPLTWRSIVNRVWQYHFGRGIVATPSDFGRMGQLPSHPELLDWLAAEFRDGGQSLKRLHRLIVLSATYRQASCGNPQAEAVDAGNAYLWRMNRRKLEAEAVRDAALAVAGQLDGSLYGPAFRDFVVEHPEHSPHYEYGLQDPGDLRIFRRAVYRFLVRSKPQPFMTVLDCADPSMQVDRRNETISPLQALALYNNAFMLTMSRHLAARVESVGGSANQVSAAFRLALGRSPTSAERDALSAHALRHGLANACRVILNLNEFSFVD